MRLTLRTMLAYLDDCLEPADAEQLSQKIEEHEFAGNLVHRIRNSMRRLRLGAPPLDGKGMGLDPNTVAEYLDNTLPQDRIPDFERICLESDVHLAEVAACHQVLTLVLGEPAEFEPALRQRMYHLPDAKRSGEAVGAVAAAGADAATEADADLASAAMGDTTAGLESKESEAEKPAPAKAKAEVPDYLREASRPRILPLAITLMLAFLLAVVALRAMGRFDRTHPLLQMLAGEPDVTVVADIQPEGPERAAEDAVARPPLASPQPDASPPAATERPPASDATVAPPEPRPEPRPEPAPPASPAAETVPEPPADEAVPAEPVPEQVPPVPADQTPPVPADEATAAVPPVPAADPTAALPALDATDAATDEPSPPVATEVDTKPVDVGRLLSEEQPLLRKDPRSKAWERLGPRAVLASGDRLIALPTYRPHVLLSPAMQVSFVGPSALKLSHPVTEEIPSLAVEYGRIWIGAVGKENTQIHLALGDVDGILTLVDADAVAAVKVRNYLPPGSNPESTPATKVVEIYSIEGQVAWRSSQAAAEDDRLVLDAGLVAGWVGDRPPRKDQASELPSWLGGGDVGTVDAMASPELARFLVTDRSLGLSLQEQVRHRRQEVRALAARSLGYLNDFEPFFALDDGVLRDANQRAHWTAHFQALRDAVARGPDAAGEIRRSLEKYRTGKADDLYRMLWGYSPEQLAQGDAAKLVEYLNHDDLDYRVLAFENLKAITGRNHMYFPHHTATQRRSAVQAWRSGLNEGLIVYKQPPSPLPPRAAPAAERPEPEPDVLDPLQE